MVNYEIERLLEYVKLNKKDYFGKKDENIGTYYEAFNNEKISKNMGLIQ